MDAVAPGVLSNRRIKLYDSTRDSERMFQGLQDDALAKRGAANGLTTEEVECSQGPLCVHLSVPVFRKNKILVVLSAKDFPTPAKDYHKSMVLSLLAVALVAALSVFRSCKVSLPATPLLQSFCISCQNKLSFLPEPKPSPEEKGVGSGCA